MTAHWQSPSPSTHLPPFSPVTPAPIAWTNSSRCWPNSASRKPSPCKRLKRETKGANAMHNSDSARPLDIAFFGSSLVSSYWNGAATYYRGIIKALAARGHRVTFYEPDAFERQQHRDMDDPEWAQVVVYEATEAAANQALQQAGDADIVVKASGVGVLDEYLEREVLRYAGSKTVIFWDVDAPATLARVHENPDDPFRALIPRYDYILTYG